MRERHSPPMEVRGADIFRLGVSLVLLGFFVGFVIGSWVN